MGNSAGKNGASIDDLTGHVMDLTKREAASAWYRYGVAVTDVYDVVDVLGRGHMGEVFTVRRKTTGHHNDLTRDRTKDGDDGDDDLISTNKREDAKEKARSRKQNSASDDSDASPGSARRRRSLKGMVHKTKKVITKQVGKAGEKSGQKLDEDANSDLTPFISSDAVIPGGYEPPKSPIRPAKSIMKDKKSVCRQSSDSSVAFTRTDTNSNSDMSVTENSNNSTPTPTPTFSRTLAADSSKSIEKANKGVHFQRTFAVKTIMTSRINTADIRELMNEIMIMRKVVGVPVVIHSFN